MKIFNRILLIFALGYGCLSLIILMNILPQNQFYPFKHQWTLVWKDDFDGMRLNQAKWGAVDRGGGYNDYSSYQRESPAISRKNVTVKDGYLILTSKREDWIGEDIFHPGQTIAGQYTSSLVETNYNYPFGRFEIRAKLPAGPGLLPYASLYPDDEDPSQGILIVGMLGADPHTLYVNNSWGTAQLPFSLQEDTGSRIYAPDYSAGFHVFAVEWEPRSIRWYVDGVKIDQTNRSIPGIPLSLKLGTSIDGATANYSKNAPPKAFMVDWVRVYRRK
ncbi:MAG TPA: glycoside hydrolase family 16 protein [Bacillota bacterium]|nr:glycoside hydrolase family 16 protein [Bacillota bacterium]